MKAAVCRAFGAPLVIEEVELAAPGPGEVQVRLKASAICHSDITAMDGGWGGTLPAVYGHEGAGIVEAIGDGVTHLKAGDHVVVTLVRHCGACHFCAGGEQVLCEGSFALDAPGPLTGRNGEQLFQGLRTGAFAESVTVDASQAVAIDASVPFDHASVLACGVITGYGAVVNTARVQPGASVAVIGVGGVGLNSIQAAALRGAEAVAALDVAPEKLAVARQFGATHAFDAKDSNVREEVRALTGGRGLDYVFVAVGVPAAIHQGMTLLRRGGTLVIVGMPPDGLVAQYDPAMVANDAHHIVGSKMGSSEIARDIPALVALYQAGRLKLGELVSARYPLEQINEAIATARSGGAIKAVLML